MSTAETKPINPDLFLIERTQSLENECSAVSVRTKSDKNPFSVGLVIPNNYFEAAIEHFDAQSLKPLSELPKLDPYKDSTAQIAIIHAYYDMNVLDTVNDGVLPRVADFNKDDTRVMVIDGPAHWLTWRKEHYKSECIDPIESVQFPVLNRPAVKFFATARYIAQQDVCALQLITAFINSDAFRALPDEHLLKIMFSSPELHSALRQPDAILDDMLNVITGNCFDSYFKRQIFNNLKIPASVFAETNFSFSPFVRMFMNFIVDMYTNFISYVNGSSNNSRFASEAMGTLDMLGCFAVEDFFIMFSRPSITTKAVKTNNEYTTVLHNSTGPALTFTDRSQYFFYDGIEVPEELYTQRTKSTYLATVIKAIKDKTAIMPFSNVRYMDIPDMRKPYINAIKACALDTTDKSKVDLSKYAAQIDEAASEALK
jgi:hypothetical protein